MEYRFSHEKGNKREEISWIRAAFFSGKLKSICEALAWNTILWQFLMRGKFYSQFQSTCIWDTKILFKTYCFQHLMHPSFSVNLIVSFNIIKPKRRLKPQHLGCPNIPPKLASQQLCCRSSQHLKCQDGEMFFQKILKCHWVIILLVILRFVYLTCIRLLLQRVGFCHCFCEIVPKKSTFVYSHRFSAISVHDIVDFLYLILGQNHDAAMSKLSMTIQRFLMISHAWRLLFFSCTSLFKSWADWAWRSLNILEVYVAENFAISFCPGKSGNKATISKQTPGLDVPAPKLVSHPMAGSC